ncbi:aromatic motif membrane protein [Mycoplasma sp. 394]
MKKWLKISLITSASVLGVAAISLVSAFVSINSNKSEFINSYTNKQESKVDYRNYLVKQVHQNDDLLTIANSYYFDESTSEQVKNEFYNEQNSINNGYLSDISSALTYAPLFIYVNSKDRSELTGKYAKKGINVLTKLLNENWFWYLNNINKFTFIYNPYGENFKDDRDYLNNQTTNIKDLLFEKLMIKNKDDEVKNTDSLLYKINKFKIKKIYEQRFINLIPDEYKEAASELNKYIDTKILFIELTDGSIMTVFVYKKQVNNQPQKHIFILPEILTTRVLGTFNEVYDVFIQSWKDAYKKSLDSLFNYQKKIIDEDENKTDAQIKKEVFAKFTDQNFAKLFERENYSEMLHRSIYEYNLNHKYNYISRFSLGDSDES